MIGLPDYTSQPTMSHEEYAVIAAEIDAEIASWKAEKASRMNEQELIDVITHGGAATTVIDGITYTLRENLDDGSILWTSLFFSLDGRHTEIWDFECIQDVLDEFPGLDWQKVTA